MQILGIVSAGMFGLFGGNFGFFQKGEMVDIDTTKPAIEQAEAANKGQYKLEYRKAKKSETPLLDALPVGAIIPYFGPWTFSDNWQLAIGQIVRDPESPLYDMKVPDLNGAYSPFEPTYLAGTLDTATLGQSFGSNTLKSAPKHTHTGKVSAAGLRFRAKTAGNGWVANQAEHRHGFSTSEEGAHNHGGDKRPQSYGIVYLIRVK